GRPLQLWIRSSPRTPRARHRPAGVRDHGCHRAARPGLRLPSRRGALQTGLRSHARGPLPGERQAVKLRGAMLSVHTCPLAAPGGKETGGMNVYVRETARELSRMGAHVDVFTRSQNPSIPRVVDMGHGARVIHLAAGPEAPMLREEIHQHLDRFVAGVEAFRWDEALDYDLIHAHYWLSGVAGLALREAWGVPVVQMFHTLGRLKNAVARTPDEMEPGLRIAEESRLVDSA